MASGHPVGVNTATEWFCRKAKIRACPVSVVEPHKQALQATMHRWPALMIRRQAKTLPLSCITHIPASAHYD